MNRARGRTFLSIPVQENHPDKSGDYSQHGYDKKRQGPVLHSADLCGKRSRSLAIRRVLGFLTSGIPACVETTAVRTFYAAPSEAWDQPRPVPQPTTTTIWRACGDIVAKPGKDRRVHSIIKVIHMSQ